MKQSVSLIKTIATLSLAAIGLLSLSSCAQTTSSAGDGGSGVGDGTISIGISNGGQQLASPPNVLVVGNITYTSVKINLGRIRIVNTNALDSIEFRQDTPLIVALRLDTSIQSIGSVSIPPGTYDKTRFVMRKLSSVDGAAYTDNLTMQDITIRATGFVKGSVDSTFVWTSALREEQVKTFAPITVLAGDTVNLVFEFDVSQWFSDGVGSQFDPRTALIAGTTKQVVENNIRSAFTVYQK